MIKIRDLTKKIICLSFIAVFITSVLAVFANSTDYYFEEGETRTFTFDGFNYEITLDRIYSDGSDEKAKIIINGEESIVEDDTYIPLGSIGKKYYLKIESIHKDSVHIKFINAEKIYVEFSNARYDSGNGPATDFLLVDITNTGNDTVVLSDYDLYMHANGEGYHSLDKYGQLLPGQTTTIKWIGSLAAPLFAEKHCAEGFDIGLEDTSVMQHLGLDCRELMAENFDIVVGSKDKAEVIVGAVDISHYLQYMGGGINSKTLLDSEVYGDIAGMKNVIVIGEVDKNSVIQKFLGNGYKPKSDAELIFYSKKDSIIIITGKDAYSIRAVASYISKSDSIFNLKYLIENKKDLSFDVTNLQTISIDDLDRYAFKRADTPEHKAKIEKTQFSETADGKLRAYVTIENTGDLDLEDTKITISIDELNLRKSKIVRGFDKGDDSSKVIEFDVPADTRPGMYMAKINIHSDNINRNKFIPVVIE